MQQFGERNSLFQYYLNRILCFFWLQKFEESDDI